MSEQFIEYLRQSLHHCFNAARSVSPFSFLPLVALTVAISLLAGCGEKKKEQPASPRPVRYLTIPAPTSHENIVRTGEIRAHDETVLAFRLDGRMVNRRVELGQRVQRGQVLAILENQTGKNQLISATADMDSAKAAEHVAALNLKRMQTLMPSGAISRVQFDNAQADWLSAVARVKSTTAAWRNAQESLSWTQLTAPAEGIITQVNASEGQVVSAGQTLFILATSDARDLVFETANSEPFLTDDAKKRVFPVTLLSSPNIRTTAMLRDISPQADAQTRTWQVRMTLHTPPPEMALGASATITIPVPTTPGYEVPASALSRQGNQPAVFIIDEDSRVQLRPVVLAGYRATSLIIASGVRPGEKIAIAGVNTLRAGEKVSLEAQLP